MNTLNYKIRYKNLIPVNNGFITKFYHTFKIIKYMNISIQHWILYITMKKREIHTLREQLVTTDQTLQAESETRKQQQYSVLQGLHNDIEKHESTLQNEQHSLNTLRLANIDLSNEYSDLQSTAQRYEQDAYTLEQQNVELQH